MFWPHNFKFNLALLLLHVHKTKLRPLLVSSSSFDETFYLSLFFCFFKWAITGLFFISFLSFQTNITIFTTSKCEKMSIQYPVPWFELTTFWLWVSPLDQGSHQYLSLLGSGFDPWPSKDPSLPWWIHYGKTNMVVRSAVRGGNW